jgi:lysophospholipase L1-like esterase
VRRRALKALLLGGGAALLLVVLGEAALRVRYGRADLPPDWNLLTRPDPDLGRRFVPGSRLDFAMLPGARGSIPVRINRLGYRGADPAPEKAPGTLRVACLGDSTTFGWFVREEEAYPFLLAAILRSRAEGRAVEVLSFGAPGHTTWRARTVLVKDALPLRPDVVVLAYGFNDGEPGGDEEARRAPDLLPRESLLAWRIRRLASRLYLGRWIASRLRLDAPRARPAPLLPERRVSPEGIEANLRWMIDRAARGGADVVLVHQNVPSPYGREAFRRVARETGVPLVEARSVLERGASPFPDASEQGLLPAGDGDLGAPALLVRARTEGEAYDVVGACSPPGSLRLDRLPLRDDGAAGDERAGDGIASLRVDGPFADSSRWVALVRSTEVFEIPDVVPAARAHFHELSLPAREGLRVTPVLPPAPAYSAVGGPRMPPDDVIHPNAQGHRALAEAIGEAISRTPAFSIWVEGK